MNRSLLAFPESSAAAGTTESATAADPLHDATLQVVAELRALPVDDAITRLCGWFDVDHAHYIGGFIFEALINHQGKLGGDVAKFLDFSVGKAARNSNRAAAFPHEALADARARIDTTVEPDVDALYRLFSLLERDEMMNVGF